MLQTDNTLQKIKIIECPRDAMQGIHDFIPTEIKIKYINQLLKVGFDTLDFGSFVSPKAIPQMQDTAQVLQNLDLSATSTKLLAIVANLRGATQAASYPEITYLGFPLSVSETFQQRNTNKSVAEALIELQQIQEICIKSNKTLVVYISMGFGNPYHDPYTPELVAEFVQKLAEMKVSVISFADTVGIALPLEIKNLFEKIVPDFPEIEFGVHLHSNPANVLPKLEAAFEAGCRRYDGAIKGYGGCPMATDTLTGNMPTELIIDFFHQKGYILSLNSQSFTASLKLAEEVF
jgi:hydroxymethylglutaryl-CoA lyase